MDGQDIDSKILKIRGQKVMLNRDLAALYGIKTRAFCQAIKRNAERFPDDFMFQLDREKFTNLMSQTVISSFRMPALASFPMPSLSAVRQLQGA